MGGQGLNEPMDYDIDNATIASANNGTKIPSSYTYTSISYPGAASTVVIGINDIWDAALINASGNVGQVVGYYYLPNSYFSHGFLIEGLVVYSSIDYPGALSTIATGINNSGQIVGSWADSNGNSHGFLLDSNTCTAYCSFDYPGGTQTSPNGINDAGQIVGNYEDANQVGHGFMYYRGNGGKFYSIDYPGTVDDTIAYGINGDGTIAGSYFNSTEGHESGFAEYAIPPTWNWNLQFCSRLSRGKQDVHHRR